MWSILLFLFCFQMTIDGNEQSKQPTVCLNMIVKDENHVICRCLESVKPLIDYWVIVDTGSTDGTQDTIKAYMADIPGELHERPWKNFEHNRNEALTLAKGKADYVLIIDADDSLIIDADFRKPVWVYDAYRLNIQHGGTGYLRLHIIRSRLPWRWKGVLHEALVCDAPYTSTILEGVTYHFGGDGARSHDPEKYLKDARVLEEALREEPDNTRYTFYLAQSYRDAGRLEDALKWYAKREAMGGWPEEVFFSMFQQAQLKQALEYPIDDVIAAYYRAHCFRPHRTEPVYFLSEIFSQQGKHPMAYSLLKGFYLIPQPAAKDVLFRSRWIEEYGLSFQLSICSYYVGHYKESLELCDLLLANNAVPDSLRPRIEKNRSYPHEKLANLKTGQEEPYLAAVGQ